MLRSGSQSVNIINPIFFFGSWHLLLWYVETLAATLTFAPHNNTTRHNLRHVVLQQTKIWNRILLGRRNTANVTIVALMGLAHTSKGHWLGRLLIVLVVLVMVISLAECTDTRVFEILLALLALVHFFLCFLQKRRMPSNIKAEWRHYKKCAVIARDAAQKHYNEQQ